MLVRRGAERVGAPKLSGLLKRPTPSPAGEGMSALEKADDRRSGGHLTVIEPARGWRSLGLHEVWSYRELLYFLVWRDVKVRYKQAGVGVGWAIIQPLMAMLVFSVIFGHLVRVPTDGVPYPIFAFCGLLPWQLFSSAFNGAGTSIVANQQLVTKVYVPRLLLPIAAMLAAVVDFTIAFLVLIGLMIYYGIEPSPRLLLLPVMVVCAVATALSVGLWIAALNVKYRDFQYTIPFITQFWFFATPVVYSTGLVPKPQQIIYGLNPMAGVIDGFRWAVLGKTSATPSMFAISGVVVLALLVGGVYFFRRLERDFADMV